MSSLKLSIMKKGNILTQMPVIIRQVSGLCNFFLPGRYVSAILTPSFKRTALIVLNLCNNWAEMGRFFQIFHRKSST